MAAVQRFGQLLSAAMERQGVSLRALRRELEQRGHRVSIATLSYWRAGRSQPEREDSLAALDDIDDLLGLPLGTLRRSLGVQALRGRAARAVQIREQGDPVHPLDPGLAALLDQLGLLPTGRLEVLEQTHTVLFDTRDLQYRWRIRTMWRARLDGVSTFPVIHVPDGKPGVVRVAPLIGCDIGQVILEPGEHVTVAEGRFPRPLKVGDLAFTAVELEPPPAARLNHPEFGTDHARGPTTLQLLFGDQPPPRDLVEFRRDDFCSPPAALTPAKIHRGSATITVAGAKGVFGFTWGLGLSPDPADIARHFA